MTKPLFEVLDWVETPIGPLCLRRRELLGRRGVIVTEVTLDHEMLMSSLNTLSEEAQATRGVALHASFDWVGRGEPSAPDVSAASVSALERGPASVATEPTSLSVAADSPVGDEEAGAPATASGGARELSVLVGGLGLGYTARAALQSERVARVRVVERFPEVIRWLRDGLVPLSDALAREPRLEVVEGDVYGLLLGPATERWDLVLIDVDHSPDEPLGDASASFYEVEGLRRVAKHLEPGGILGVWSAGDDDPRFAAALAEVFPETRIERVCWVNELIDDGLDVEDVLFFARKPL